MHDSPALAQNTSSDILNMAEQHAVDMHSCQWAQTHLTHTRMLLEFNKMKKPPSLAIGGPSVAVGEQDSSTAGKTKPPTASQRWSDNSYDEAKRIYDARHRLSMSEQHLRLVILHQEALLDSLAYKAVLADITQANMSRALLGINAPSYLGMARGPSRMPALLSHHLPSQASQAYNLAEWLLHQDLLAKAKATPSTRAELLLYQDLLAKAKATPSTKASDTPSTKANTAAAVSDVVVEDKIPEKDSDSNASNARKCKPRKECKPRKATKRWWDNYKEVKRVYDEHGHLTMPDERLRHWLSYQRNHASTLTDEQKEALERIQYRKIFNFRKSDEEDWQANFNRLISDPSAQEDEKIKRWISRQRRMKLLGELSAERMKMLEKHVYLGAKNGHCGKSKRSGKRRDAYWSEMFERLLEYQKKNGDLNVPARYPEDKSLGYWVLEQRRRFRQTDKDGLQKMEQDKVEKLNSIGFAWNIKPLKK